MTSLKPSPKLTRTNQDDYLAPAVMLSGFRVLPQPWCREGCLTRGTLTGQWWKP